ncbi:MAG: hypothetical protein CMG17_04605 [Candidatus Marinimicrobia bacterium]|jgi:hypothetical protein|nr:hypothetical protein [Candidatus Neomarinimicrobiota bacterium]MBL46386.1 hypothetical protein [Candidatus Neomarinimicrobiota bacterium]MEC8703157.1 DUF3108 domain-containing protein [Candidatus Neomarinimicrobiota bacterium]|tara:strand:- start:31 stop:735 length:705 start_codon:yes stop_codon:yes gene_type:complete
MKKILFIIIFHTAVFAINNPFKVGELLKYSAEWNGIKVGNAELFLSGTELFNDVETYQITFTTRTNGLANTLFPIRDRVDVWIDKKELFTHRIKKDINQSTYKEKIDVSFNYDELKALSNDKSVDIDFKARGPYSMFYFLRTIDLIPEKIMSFSSYEGKRIVNYNLKMTGTEIVDSGLGKFSCKVIKPFSEGKELFKNKGDMRIWISETKERLPIKIQIKIQYGSMTLTLDEIN